MGLMLDMLGLDGLWSYVSPSSKRGSAALFLDRDGVIVEETNYLRRPEDVTIIPGAAEVVAAANRLAVPVIIVTNQAGIGRGYYGWQEFAAVQEEIFTALARKGSHIDAAYACAHHPEGEGVYKHPDHPGRKPNPGMILRAGFDLGLDLSISWLVGDNVIDILAARRAGLAGALHVATGHGERDRDAALRLARGDFRVQEGLSVRDALKLPLLMRR